MKRVFNIDIEICRACSAAVRIIACIEDPLVIEKILTHLIEKSDSAEGSGCRRIGRHGRRARRQPVATSAGLRHRIARQGGGWSGGRPTSEKCDGRRALSWTWVREIPVGVLVKNAADNAIHGAHETGSRPKEAAGAVSLLCLPRSGYMSGQMIEVTGARYPSRVQIGVQYQMEKS